MSGYLCEENSCFRVEGVGRQEDIPLPMVFRRASVLLWLQCEGKARQVVVSYDSSDQKASRLVV